MRVIKFRAKNKKGNWIYGMPTYDFNYIFNDQMTDSPDNYKIDKKTLGEFSGQKDKNKNEIYESDLVIHKDYKCIFRIVFDSGMFYGLSKDGKSFDFNEAFINKIVEKIGNIYDHPELINIKL